MDTLYPRRERLQCGHLESWGQPHAAGEWVQEEGVEPTVTFVTAAQRGDLCHAVCHACYSSTEACRCFTRVEEADVQRLLGQLRGCGDWGHRARYETLQTATLLKRNRLEVLSADPTDLLAVPVAMKGHRLLTADDIMLMLQR